MMFRWRGLVLSAVLGLAPLTSWAQGIDAGIGGSALISVQPIDDAYVGGPYLSEGIGGIGPGISATFNIVTERGFIVSAEFSTAWFEQAQSGRLVPGPCPPGVPSNQCSSVGGVGTTQLHDSMLGGLVGYAARNGATQVHFLGGVYWLIDQPTVNGEAVMEHGSLDGRTDPPLALGGGLDVVRGIGTKASLVVGARYTYLSRDEALRYLGIGPHVLRAGVGLRLRLN